uniref:Ion transport domain-containing protein n=1 Tax=Eutreptiella gymnastica TaxID=73025 RepID=A0A7S4CQ16_9EUGL
MVELLDSGEVRLLLRATTLNLQKLGQTALVILIVVYFYATAGFRFFREYHDPEKCSTLLGCATAYMDGGLSGSGIHDTLTFESPNTIWSDNWIQWLLTIVQMSFLTIYVQILLVVAQGIIIDSFGQLRDENAEVTERLKGACFICGLERHVLDQYPGGMEAHIARDHHSWNYVDLFVLLQTTPRCRLTDLEEYVHDCVQHGDTSWIPSKQCLAATSEESKHDPQVESLKAQLSVVTQKLEHLESQLTEQMAQLATKTEEPRPAEEHVAVGLVRHETVRMPKGMRMAKSRKIPSVRFGGVATISADDTMKGTAINVRPPTHPPTHVAPRPSP